MTRRAAPTRWLVLASAALGAGLTLAQLLSHPLQLAFAQLAAFAFVASTLLGGLALLAMTIVLGARWFVVLQRICLALTSPTVLLPLLFLPTALRLRAIYPWASSALVDAETSARARQAHALGLVWMSAGPFLVRAGVYLLLWIVISEALLSAARAGDRGVKSWSLVHRAAISALALPALGFSGSWATFDWLMSAVPDWNMTSIGLYVLIGGFTSALGVLAMLAHWGRVSGVLPEQVGAAHSLALGRLLLAAVCLWAYIAVSQLIIVWSANLPREAAFYLPRARGAWRYLAGLLVFGHFVVPFALLLSRAWKQRSGFLAGLGAWIVLMHAIDLYWLLVPSASAEPSFLDIGPFLLFASLAAWLGVLRSASNASRPVTDAELARSLGYESP